MGNGSGTNQLRKMQWSSGRLPTKPKTGEAVKLQDANNVTLQPFLGHHLDILPDCDPVLLLPHYLVSTIDSHLLSLLCYHYVPPWLSLAHQELKKSHAAVKTKWPQVKSVAILATSETCSRFIRAIQFIHFCWWPFVHSIGFLGREEARSASSICSPCHSARHSTFKGRWCSPRHTCTLLCYMSLFSGCWNITYQCLINLIGQQSLKAFCHQRNRTVLYTFYVFWRVFNYCFCEKHQEIIPCFSLGFGSPMFSFRVIILPLCVQHPSLN